MGLGRTQRLPANTHGRERCRLGPRFLRGVRSACLVAHSIAFSVADKRGRLHPRPNVRGNRRAEARRLGPVGENVQRTASRAKVACRSASG